MLTRRLAGVVRRLRPPPQVPFDASDQFWERRYARGGNSGPGSYGRLAEFKAEVLNGFVEEHAIRTVAELGCGDGNQLALARYPTYVGLDVSVHAVERCRSRFATDPTKRFLVASPEAYADLSAELAISLDVVFHLVEDEVYEAYMQQLFRVAAQYVAVYSSDFDGTTHYPFVRHRRFTAWVEAHEQGWEMFRRVPNRYPLQGRPDVGSRDRSVSDFYFFRRAA